MDKKVLKILPIVDDVPRDHNKVLHPNLPQPPFLMVLFGSIKAGKSTILNSVFLNDDFYRGYFDRIYWTSNTVHNDRTSRFLKDEDNIELISEYDDELIKGVISMMDAEERDDKETVAMVFDDILPLPRECYANYLATRFRHHLPDGALIFSSQNYKSIPPVVRNNMTCCIICKQHNQKELQKIEEEVDGMFHGNFISLYNEAINHHKYAFLMLRLDENPCEAWICFEQKIYPKEHVCD